MSRFSESPAKSQSTKISVVCSFGLDTFPMTNDNIKRHMGVNSVILRKSLVFYHLKRKTETKHYCVHKSIFYLTGSTKSLLYIITAT